LGSRARALTIAATAAVLCAAPLEAAAEWQIKPFLGLMFGGETTFVDLEKAAGHPSATVGASLVWLSDIIGFEADVGHAPGYFQSGDQQLVVRSGVTTVTGNAVVALPRRLSRYTLRPYVAGGAGVMHVYADDARGVFKLSSTLATIDVGGGITGFITDRLGVSWDVRYFHSVGGNDEKLGVSFGAEQLSSWRAAMALAIRVQKTGAP
jgi:hypothetical protein